MVESGTWPALWHSSMSFYWLIEGRAHCLPPRLCIITLHPHGEPRIHLPAAPEMSLITPPTESQAVNLPHSPSYLYGVGGLRAQAPGVHLYSVCSQPFSCAMVVVWFGTVLRPL